MAARWSSSNVGQIAANPTIDMHTQELLYRKTFEL